MATPFRCVHLDTVPSTMDEARSRFDGEATLVTAQRQTGGRGRAGRAWVHADRAVAASLALAPGWAADQVPLIPLVAGIAAAGTFGVALKWPNDLVTGGAKVGGILAEGPGDPVVIGMGVNLYWRSPIEGAGSLLAADPGGEAAAAMAEAWARDLLRRIEQGPGHWGRPEYEGLCVTVGRDITWDPDGRGTAVAVDESGRLVVETAAGVVSLDAGEVRHVRAAQG